MKLCGTVILQSTELRVGGPSPSGCRPQAEVLTTLGQCQPQIWSAFGQQIVPPTQSHGRRCLLEVNSLPLSPGGSGSGQRTFRKQFDAGSQYKNLFRTRIRSDKVVG